MVVAPALVGRAMGGGGDAGAVVAGVSAGISAGAVGATSTGDVAAALSLLSVLSGSSAGWLSWAPQTWHRVSPERVAEPQCGQIVPSKTLTSSHGAVTQVGRLLAAVSLRGPQYNRKGASGYAGSAPHCHTQEYATQVIRAVIRLGSEREGSGAGATSSPISSHTAAAPRRGRECPPVAGATPGSSGCPRVPAAW